ncbi:MAG: hypothetical protein A4E72_01316 [Syntrophus sp. PtaU1.Bin208]|nr:MAG: hypothetical protein A4E72_01316 [Syntrophus sp. PtaU1.Bin208]
MFRTDNRAGGQRFGNGRRQPDLHEGIGIADACFQGCLAKPMDSFGILQQEPRHVFHTDQEKGRGKRPHNPAGTGDLFADLIDEDSCRFQVRGETSVLVRISRLNSVEVGNILNSRCVEVCGVVQGITDFGPHRLRLDIKIGKDANPVILELPIGLDMGFSYQSSVIPEFRHLAADNPGSAIGDIGIAGQTVYSLSLVVGRYSFQGSHLVFSHDSNPPLMSWPFLPLPRHWRHSRPHRSARQNPAKSARRQP